VNARPAAWDLIFSVGLFTLVLLGVVAATEWQFRAKLLPLAIGIPVLGLLAIQIVRAGLIYVAERKAVPDAATGDAPMRDEATGVEAIGISPTGFDAAATVWNTRRAAVILAWLFIAFAAIWLLGFAIGATLLMVGYLRISARERWPVVAAMSIGAFLFVLALKRWLFLPFPVGEVFRALGVDLGF
jgi:hypothetical protein